MKPSRLLLVLGGLLLVAVGVAVFTRRVGGADANAAAETPSAVSVKYQCPMHPQIVRNEPGDCPICHMRLQKVEEKPAAPAAGDDSPIHADEREGNGDGAVPGRAAFTLSAERRQLIGVRSQAAQVSDIIKTLRLPGRIGELKTTVLGQALEMDGSVLKPGLWAEVLVPGGDAVPARVVSVDRLLDSFSRTFGVLLALQGRPASSLRPGVYVDVRIKLKLAHALAVPKEAVLDTGERQWVFVQQEGGRFEPRLVHLGVEGDEQVELRRGVQAGERVVSSANFLIDSESRFQAAIQAFAGGGHD
jgi:hypothetical protein